MEPIAVATPFKRFQVEKELSSAYLGVSYRPPQPTPSRPYQPFQPWRDIWPPQSGTPYYDYLVRNHPEVLSWRFDPDRAFDSPWRQGWKDCSPMHNAHLPALESATTFKVADSMIGSCHAETPSPTPSSRQELEDLLTSLNLPHVTPAEFNYLAPSELYDDQKPYKCQLPPYPGFTMRNLEAQSYPVKIHDITGHEDRFTLDTSAFQYIKCPVWLAHWSEQTVCDEYLPKMQEWLTRYFGAEKVKIYSYSFRKQGPKQTKAAGWKPPVLRAHCDASESTCAARLPFFFPTNHQDLLRTKRIRYINLWRPLSVPVQDIPLAVCDFRSIHARDLVPMDIVYPHFLDEAYEMRFNASHRWLYRPRMGWDDALVFKLHDTQGGASVCPHGAFADPSVRPGSVPPRASIEIKAIVVG